MNISQSFIRNSYFSILKNLSSPVVSSFRNTFIVKRLKEPPIKKKNAERPRILKGRHFIYETVEDTDLTPPPDLHVILTTFVDGIGDAGDVISVDPFYARENLLLPQKAVYASPENLKKYAEAKEKRGTNLTFSSIHAPMTVKVLSRVTIPVFMNNTASWTIEKSHIHIAFRSEGFHVPADAIEISSVPIEGPDPEKEGKDFVAFVSINKTEKVPVRCRLFHVRPGMERAKLSDDLYLEKGEPILEEEKTLLESMPEPEVMNDPSTSISLVEKYRIQYIK